MQITTNDSSRMSQIIALVIVETAVFVALFAYWAGRYDPSLRQQSVLLMVGLVSNLVGLGSGLLVGGGKTQHVETPTPAKITNSDTTTISTPNPLPTETQP